MQTDFMSREKLEGKVKLDQTKGDQRNSQVLCAEQSEKKGRHPRRFLITGSVFHGHYFTRPSADRSSSQEKNRRGVTLVGEQGPRGMGKAEVKRNNLNPTLISKGAGVPGLIPYDRRTAVQRKKSNRFDVRKRERERRSNLASWGSRAAVL